jgi:hypothetical protein
MKLRNASFLLLVLGLSWMPAGGQETGGAASTPDSDAQGRFDFKVFFTGHLLGYYRLPEWQSADFQKKCPSPQPYTPADATAESNPAKREELSAAKTPADAFLSEARRGERDGYLLLGMGDNFGVTLESRAWRNRVGPDKAWQLHAKSRTLDGPNGDPNWKSPLQDAIGDNVGCFFSRAGYDAIVPGKEDFYFGPERLRRIAERLANVNEKMEGMHKVRMLAANLVLKTDYLKKPPEIQDADKGLKFVPGMPTGIKSVDVSDNGTLPPFARQIRFEISSTSLYYVAASAAPGSSSKTKLEFAPFLCPVDSTEGLDKLDPAACMESKEEGKKAQWLIERFKEDKTAKEKSAEDSCAAEKPKEKSEEEKAAEKKAKEEKSAAEKAVWDFTLPKWQRLPALYGLCAKIDPADLGNKSQDGVYYDKKRWDTQRKTTSYYCERFTVVEPLFGDATTDPWVFRPVKANPPVDAAHADGTKPGFAVIFGVVDKELTTLVGRDNLAWRNLERKTEPGPQSKQRDKVQPGKETYGTVVDTLEEATTLGMAVRSFDLAWRDPGWRKDHGVPVCTAVAPFKVLLAQMTRGKAETLGANLAGMKVGQTSLRFDVVVSAAAEFSAATANEVVRFRRPARITKAAKAATGAEAVESKAPEFRQLVVVPWLAYDKENSRLPDPLRYITVYDSDAKSGINQKRSFDVGGNYEKFLPLSEPISQEELTADYNGMGHAYLAGKGYWRSPVQPKGSAANSSSANESNSTAGSSSATEPSSGAESSATQQPGLKSPPPPLENAFALAVLAALRDRTHADVAMLQKRAFYWGPFPNPQNSSAGLTQPNGELLERILWMGDYLEVLSVKGSTLKKVLDDSDKLDALDERATHETVETARGLLALGIEKTRDKQYLVDGMQLDPNRLYTVATSNHIAAGDNGYPELADPQFADPRLPADKDDHDEDDKTPRISWLVCQELGGEFCVSNPGLLFASIQEPHLPSQLEPALADRIVRPYWRSLLGVPELLGDGYNRTNYQAQLNPTWRLSLKDLSFNLSSVRNNLAEPERLTELGGVTEPGAGNAKSHAIAFSTHAEWVRSGKWFDEFVRSLGEYEDTVTGNTATVPIAAATGTLNNVLYPAPALTTYSKNQFGADLGFYWHPGLLWRPTGHKYFDKVGLVLEPLHFDTQIAAESLPFAAVYDPTGSGNALIPAISVPLPRNRNILQRIAFRTESDKNHFEAGYQGGWERGALESLTTNLGICPALIITLCLETQELQPGFLANSVSETQATRERHGPYADLDWTLPLLWKLGFRIQDSFDYYGPAHLDNAIDTLYRNDATETLNFKLLPNLNIGPSLERFDYENKIERVHLRTWSPSIKLTYSFDWLEGGNWKKSLRYSSSAGGASQ